MRSSRPRRFLLGEHDLEGVDWVVGEDAGSAQEKPAETFDVMSGDA